MQLPSETSLRAIVQRYGNLLVGLGSELGERPMVLPDGDFFPDTFLGDQPSAERLVHRMRHHAGMDDIPVEVRVLGDAEDGGSSCSSGSCSAPKVQATEGLQRLVPNEASDGWILQLHPGELRHPVALTASVARALANVFLLETLEGGEAVEQPVEVTNDLLAVALGFGSLMLAGSYMYSKSCGGPSVQKVTHLGVGELAMAFALFVARGEHDPRRAARELGATQRELFKEARDWVLPNKALVRALRTQPGSLAEGHFQLSEPKPWLLRVLGIGKGRTEQDPLAGFEDLENMASDLVPAQAKKKAATPDPQRDELRALVDEALTARSEAP